MKLKPEFITHVTPTEAMLVPTGAANFSGLVRGNKTFGAVLEQLKKDTTEETIVAALMERFDAPEEVVARDVKKTLSELRKIEALDG